jgi:hypothetical protein
MREKSSKISFRAWGIIDDTLSIIVVRRCAQTGSGRQLCEAALLGS